MQARMNPSNAETEVKSSVRLQGFTRMGPRRFRNLAGEDEQRRVGTAAAWFGRFRGEHSGGISARPAGSASAESSTSHSRAKARRDRSVQAMAESQQLTFRFQQAFTAEQTNGAGWLHWYSLAPCQKPRFWWASSSRSPCRGSARIWPGVGTSSVSDCSHCSRCSYSSRQPAVLASWQTGSRGLGPARILLVAVGLHPPQSSVGFEHHGSAKPCRARVPSGAAWLGRMVAERGLELCPPPLGGRLQPSWNW